jgi:phage baseplate assembly protein W
MALRKVLSAEDGDLQKTTLISSRRVNYVDIDLAFAKRPSGDIYKKKDAAAVKQAIKNLLLTNQYEKPFRPFYGVNLQNMLFELADEDTENEIRANIVNSIERFEPRVEVQELRVVVLPEQHDIRVTLIFKIINTSEEVEFTTNLSRLR